MNQRSIGTLEYPKIREILKSYCVTKGGKALAEALQPMIDWLSIENALDLVEEGVGMVLRNGRPPMAELADTNDFVGRAKIGSMLSMGELLSIAAMLRVSRDMERYYDEDTQNNSLIVLKSLFLGLDPLEILEKEISYKILSESEMSDNASVELARIRREINIKSNRITEKLNTIISSPKYEKYLQDRLITVRGNRYVVPVKQEYRNMIPGLVLDKSGTGATLFIEPMAVVELNNDLKELAIEEEKEVTRILKLLSQKIGQMSEILLDNYGILTELDFIFGKAKYALYLGGERVKIKSKGKPHLLKARHPLLDMKTAVASDIVMDEDINSLIITGPNTGGKTVTLKTLGLLTLMIQSGLFVPVKEGSQTGIFQEVYADIGDEQSIEQSLSTFSSHMTNIVKILKEADEKSLVLFDELGAGTDPTEGAALAIAILNALHERNVITAATTHYSELKEYALVTPGVVNASVEFNVETLRPTYRLLIGVPGKSNAFEISRRLGLMDEIIEKAKENIEVSSVRFEETLDKLEIQRKKSEDMLQKIEAIKREADTLKEATIQDNIRAEQERRMLLEKAKEESQKIVTETREKTDSIYKEIRLIQETTVEEMGDNKKLEALRRDISEHEKSIYEIYKDKVKENPAKFQASQTAKQEIKVGDQVYIQSLSKEGEVLEIIKKEKKALVMAGILKVKVPLEELALKHVQKTTIQAKKPIKSVDRHTMEKRLDLRGRNGEESLYLVEKMISDAIVSGTKEVLILHGKGTGKLRQVIRAYLKDNTFVENFRDGAPNEGGTGVTVVRF